MKKTFLTAFGIILFATIVNGQDHKFSIGLVGSPDMYSYGNLPTMDNNTKINFSTGIRLEYYFTEKLSLKYGILYSTKSYCYNWKFTGEMPNDPVLPKQSNLLATYIDHPLLLSYTLIKKNKLSLYTSVGVVTDYFIKVKNTYSVLNNGTEMIDTDIEEYLKTKMNTFLISSMMDLGAKYDLNPNISLSLEPYFKYYFSKVDNDEPKSKPISYGAVIGIHYNFIPKVKN